MTFIYTLSDPRSSSIRYVGITVDPAKRLAEHCKPTRKPRGRSRCHRENWIRSLQKKGLTPAMDIVDVVADASRAALLEICLIKGLREAGAKLTNGTDGGDNFIGAFRGKA